MNVGYSPNQRRGGFTLVELLVVIAIIAVLMGLLVPAVMRLMTKGPEVQVQSEISQLATAIENFKKTYNVSYIPSQIKLCEFYQDYNQNNQLDKDSITYLLMLWPNLMQPDPASPGNGPIWRYGGIDWSGTGIQTNGWAAPSRFWVLEGHQCLVFFLGGIPIQGTPAGVMGFSSRDYDPAATGISGWGQKAQPTGRKGPFFEFKSDRLVKISTAGTQKNGALFYSYVDPFGTNKPYLYFSNYGTRNGYNSPLTSKYPTGDNAAFGPAPYGVQPYYERNTPVVFLNPSLFQILSAGADGNFGPGGQYTSATAGGLPTAAKDDHSNFTNGAVLAAGQ